jgi:hypothetical protein
MVRAMAKAMDMDRKAVIEGQGRPLIGRANILKTYK